MKNITLFVAFAATAVAVTVAPALAAGVTLQNNGLGQRAGDVTNFGLAICNSGSQDLAQAVSVLVSGNGQSATVSTPASLSAGTCSYLYVPYAGLGLASGNTYSVTTTIDPNRTVVSNTDTQATYSVTVPPGVGQVHGASITTVPNAANVANTTTRGTVQLDPAARTRLLAQLASMMATLQQLLAKLHLMGK